MRILLALIIALPLLMAASLEADAGLVEDLRSGKSNVRTSSAGNYPGIIKFLREVKSKPDFKAIASARTHVYGSIGNSSAEAAVEGALTFCKESGGGTTTCKIYAVGDNIVQGHSQAELADVIEAYQLEVSGSKTTSKSTPADGNYCKTGVGNVYGPVGWFCGDFGDTKITKAEYDRLKNKKTDTVNDASTKDKASGSSESLKAKLKELKDLLDEGLITEEEAAAKRAKLLEDM